MADITLKLIWYRLGEVSENMAERYVQFLEWYKNFDYRNIDIVDALFVGWIVVCGLIVGILQLHLTLRGPRNNEASPKKDSKSKKSILQNLNTKIQSNPPSVSGPSESCQWLNSTINWVYLNYKSTPGFVFSWLDALNEEAKKVEGVTSHVRFDRILAGSLPPRVTNVHTEAGTKDSFTIHGSLDSSELGFQIMVSNHTVSSVDLCNCDVNVQLLKGDLQSETVLAKDEVHCFVRFTKVPEIALVVKPHKDFRNQIDLQQIEEIIKRAITKAVTHFQLSTTVLANMPTPPPGGIQDGISQMQNHVPPAATSESVGRVIEPRIAPQMEPKIEAVLPIIDMYVENGKEEVTPTKREVQDFFTPPRIIKGHGDLNNISGDKRLQSARPTRTSEVLRRQDKRLLCKIIKASGLGSKDFGCAEPYCIVEMDDPPQRHCTSVVKNTVNPFWDEHFLFDMSSSSQEVIFEIYDREKPPGDDFLGMAAVQIDELLKTPSSRQIIPLAGRAPGTGKGGNITVEFLFMEPAETSIIHADERELMLDAAANLSPRRRIETNKTMMPGGLVVTTQTTSMDRRRVNEMNGEDSPSPRSDRKDFNRQHSEDSLSRGSRGSRIEVGLNGGDNVIDNKDAQLRKTSKGVANRTPSPIVKRDPVRIPEIKMTESTPTEELRDDGRLSSTSSEQQPRVESMPVEPVKTYEIVEASPSKPEVVTNGEGQASGGARKSRPITKEPGIAASEPELGPKRNKPKRSSSIASTIRKRFSRSKKPRSHSADRAGSEGKHLRPPNQYTKSSEDLDSVDIPGHTSNLQKSRSIGSSLKQLFRRKRRSSNAADVTASRSRESSVSRSRDRLTPENDGTLTRPSPETRRGGPVSSSGRQSTQSEV